MGKLDACGGIGERRRLPVRGVEGAAGIVTFRTWAAMSERRGLRG